jgi:hypothetical protein
LDEREFDPRPFGNAAARNPAMRYPAIRQAAIAAAVLSGMAAKAPLAVAADDIWDLINPAWWFGLTDDDDDWRYWAYGPGRYAGHGYPGPGWGWPHGWDYPGYGYGGWYTRHMAGFAGGQTAAAEPAPEPKPPE